MRVLVVDDSRVSLRVTQMFLEAIGHEAVCVTSPTEFLTQLSDVRPDALLVDVDMPAIRGDKLVSIIRERRQHDGVRIVLHSSRPADQLRAFANECGADGIIEKTSSGAAFYAAFSTAIGMPVAPEKAMPTLHGGVALRRLPAPLRLGIPWMDAHHQMLYSTLREFVEQSSEGNRVKTEIFIGFLERYASFHFSAEDRLMTEGTAETIEHRAEHETFLGKVREFRSELSDPVLQAETAQRLATFIGEWVTKHINETDRTLVATQRPAH